MEEWMASVWTSSEKQRFSAGANSYSITLSPEHEELVRIARLNNSLDHRLGDRES